MLYLGFPGGSVGKESACNTGDPSLKPRSGGSPGEEMATHFSILAWEIPWTEEPGGVARVGRNLATKPPPSAISKCFKIYKFSV